LRRVLSGAQIDAPAGAPRPSRRGAAAISLSSAKPLLLQQARGDRRSLAAAQYTISGRFVVARRDAYGEVIQLGC
jgi:hypothetical protein